MATNWIQQAVNPAHKGVFAAKAKKAGMSTAAFAKKKHTGKTAKQANLALTLSKLRGNK